MSVKTSAEPPYSIPFTDGNGRMGRLPVESLIFEHQDEYYQALQESTEQTDSAPFIIFMLRMILAAMATATPQVGPQVGKRLQVIQGEMSREGLQAALGLQDRKSFRERYLRPALGAGLIEMTIPDKPKSRLQHYRLTDRGRQWLLEQGFRGLT